MNEFNLCVVYDNGIHEYLSDDDYPLQKRLKLGPNEDIAKIYIMEANENDERAQLTEEVCVRMWVHVCYVHMYACTYWWMYVCAHMCVHTCVCVCACVFTCVCTYVCVHVCTYVCAYMCVCTYMCVCARIIMCV